MNRVPPDSDRRARYPRARALLLASAAAGIAGLANSARADNTDAAWVGFGGNTSWFNTINWDTNLVPSGTGAIATFDGPSGGAVVLLGSNTIQLSRLNLNDPLFTSLVGGTIELVGSAIVHSEGTNFDLPDKVFPFFGSTSPSNLLPGNNIGGVGSYSATFIGTNGLNKTGDSHLQINSTQFYSGTTSITGGGKIITAIGDGAFGVGGNGISLNNGSIQVASNNWTTSRTINIGTLGGSVYWVEANRSIDFSGNFTGSGTLNLNGKFGVNVGQMVVRTANSFSGTLNLAGGSVSLIDNGAFLNVPQIVNSGTLILNNSNSGTTNVNRIADTMPMTMRGAALTVTGGTGNYNETIGTLTLHGGVNYITVNAGTGGARLNVGTVNMQNKAGLVVRGNNLGLAPGANNSNVFINNGTSLLNNKALLPYTWVNPSFSGTATPENANNVLATYGTNGVTPILSYLGTFTGANSNSDVRVTANSTVTGDTFINSLVIAAPQSLVRSGTFGQTAGITVATAGGILHPDSGIVLSANAGFLNNGSQQFLNSSPGNIINADLDFGDGSLYPAREAIFLTPSALRVNGVISGTQGLTKIGPRTLELTGPSIYTGTTFLTGFNRFSGNVFGDGFTPTAYGLDTSAIILYGGNADAYNPNTLTANGTGLGVLGANSGGAVHFDRAIELRGDWVQLRNFGNGTVTWNGTLTTADSTTLLMFMQSKATAHQVVNAPILGPGRVVIGAVDPNPLTSGDPEETWVDLMQPNTFNGGLVISGGTVGIGADGAMGTGSVQFNGSGLITALGGPRTINNDLVIYNTTLGIGGSNTMTFNGEINGRGGDFIANITSSADTTFAGAITGGGFYKQGNGTLVIKGNNTFTGVLKVGNGSIAGGMVVLQSNTGLGATAGPSGVEAGSNTLALDGASLPGGGMVIGQEQLYFRGAGVGSLGALRSLTGDNIWNSSLSPSARYIGEGTASPTVDVQFATIGVDSGSTLTISGAILGDDPGARNNLGSTVFLANSIGVHKTGPGMLIVGAHVVDSTVGTNSFNWNGSIIASGSLNIQQGTVQIKSQAGVPSISDGKSVVDIGSLVISGGTLTPSAQLDLTDNAMVIDYTGTIANSPAATIRNYLRAGYNGGSWNGNGIISSRAASSPNAGEEGLTGIAFAEATTLGITEFFDDPLDGNALIMRYAYMGDANLDGKVDQSDLGRMAINWQQTNRGWYDGDFDYNGLVDVLDLILLSNNWYIGINNPLASASLGQALGQLNLPAIPIPEPSIALYGALFTASTLLRRRNNSATSVQ